MKWKMTHIIRMLICSVMVSCNNEVLLDNTDTQLPGGDGFYVSLKLEGQTAGRATQSGVDDLREDFIATADLFIVDTNENVRYYHHAAVENDLPVKIYDEDWKTAMEDGTYTLYALANYKGESNLGFISTLDDLKKVIAIDEEICKWEGMSGYQEKTFLMDGNCSFVKDGTSSDQYIVTVNMSRAASKVQISVSLSEDFAEKFSSSDFKVSVRQYATRTAAWANAAMPDASERGFSTQEFTKDLVYEGNSPSSSERVKLRFYTYVNEWEDAVADETMVLIDIPGAYAADGGASPTTYEHNYYKVPIIIGNDVKKELKRNHFYQMDVTVDMLGASQIDNPVTLDGAQFSVAEWGKEEVNVGNDEITFLTLSEDVIDIRNVDGYDKLEFYSSSPIQNVEFVSGTEALNSGIEFDYPGSGDEIPAIYFVDKNNNKKKVDRANVNNAGRDEQKESMELKWDHDGTTGVIYITSPNPINVTKRYITLKITNQDGLVKYVVVVQSPLEYIQPIEGYYSYRDDFLSPTAVTPSQVPCTWESSFTGNKEANLPVHNSDMDFYSKVCIDGTIYRYNFSRSNRTYKAQQGSKASRQNNMMYFVTITQTDGKYKIAHPLKEKIDGQEYVVSSVENDRLVSPAFMLASQLGALGDPSNSTWNNARKHCANYVETYIGKDGETKYLDDWRLPTSAEINVIIGYQSDSNVSDVMETVLTGKAYYISYQNKGSATVPNYTGGNGTYVRCIRDVKPGDFE